MLYLSEFLVVNSAVGMMLPIFSAEEVITPPPEIDPTVVDALKKIDPAMVDAFITAINLVSIAGYLITAFFCYKIYQKLNVEDAWYAWIPILGTYITFKAADEEKPVLWTILSYIPCVNIIAAIKSIMAWVTIFKKLNKSPWLLLICIIPFAAFFVFGYVAFT
ncbi:MULTISPECIES: DUF5684 domain-containing protein [unclassified Okeania]|uniref:DUF5684 domain-containing protein n=1 Tax=unclassified Okeania TaxID=2634635 RepID=UPI00257E4359|nr:MULTISPECIES: DUF5684 domain-containing protein [unclassified Okeania]